ncbi:alpha/beta hydrolase [Pleurocapsales cyanobacterium LEGE 06147]|nr:alpha/beta hydrolase [Pleurocapsales cyanobacterium LEGE 06147]
MMLRRLKAFATTTTERLQIFTNLVYLREIEYGRGGERILKIDILHRRNLPEEAMPVLVWIHGGGWCQGRKEEGIKWLIPFANRGYFCASIEYRLSQEAHFPAQIEDCKCAIRFLGAHAKKFHLKEECIGVWGISAGGHLAALLGTTSHVKKLEGQGGWHQFSSRVRAVCDWFGPTDFLRMNDFPSKIDHDAADSPEGMPIGGAIQENQEKAARANPITYLTGEASPFPIVHADNDRLVPFNQSQLLYEALKQAGVEVTLEMVKGGGHGEKFNASIVLKKVEKFFNKHLQ